MILLLPLLRDCHAEGRWFMGVGPANCLEHHNTAGECYGAYTIALMDQQLHVDVSMLEKYRNTKW